MWPDTFSFSPNREDDRAVILGEDRCALHIGGESVVLDARIAFRPHRFPSTQIELATFELAVDEEIPVSLDLEISGLTLKDGRLSAIPWEERSSASRYGYRVRQTEPMILAQSGEIGEAEALVYNLSRFSFGGGPSNGREELTLEIPGGWKVTIGPLAPELYKDKQAFELLGSPWRRPTHSLRLTRPHGSGSTSADLHDMLFLFQYFVSFAWGRFVGIGLVQGRSSSGALSYAMPGITHIDPQTHPVARNVHWFPPSQAEILAEILPGFWQKMTDPQWRESVEWGIYWWLSANHATGVSEASILASQSGLESLSLSVLCRLGGLPRRQVEDMSAAEKIRKMLGLMRAPQDIPGQLSDLRSVAATKGWDGPQALTKVRNALVHPSKGSETGLAFEASQLGLWYLELMLLFLFGYKGRILNRTVFHAPWFQEELVPWA